MAISSSDFGAMANKQTVLKIGIFTVRLVTDFTSNPGLEEVYLLCQLGYEVLYLLSE